MRAVIERADGRELPATAALVRITCVALITTGLLSPHSLAAQDLILVQGAGGGEKYDEMFTQWMTRWREASDEMEFSSVRSIQPTQAGESGHADASNRDQLKEAIDALRDQPGRPAYLVLIGHGTFHEGQAKFNLAGPDVTAEELASWLGQVDRPFAIVNCASSSGAFINRLSRDGRIVVTATKSGVEYNFSRFGQYFAEACADDAADLDHDGAISLLEAFLMASRKTQQFYSEEGRLATEHALLDDNGDGVGTTEDFFRGIRAVGKTKDASQAIDGLRAHQWTLFRYSDEPDLAEESRRRRDELEKQIEDLRRLKPDLNEDEFYKRLEPMMVEMAQLYATAGSSKNGDSPSPPGENE